MPITRRDFLASAALLPAAAGHHQMAHLPPVAKAPKLVIPGNLTPFVDPLPCPPVTEPAAHRPSPTDSKKQIPCYELPIQEFFSKVHRDVPATRFWGYGNSMPGPTIEARSGEEILIEWQNKLPARHFLPIDHNLMGAEKDKPEVRTVVHLHGAKAHPASDGYPEDWFVAGQSKVYHYANQQDAAMLWYHDHAMGINRLNVCAGMLGTYIVRDSFEDSLNLPKGEFEIPLVLTDRFLREDGQLYYPVSQRLDAPWVAEFFGDAVLINGKLLPYLEVQPRKYRFRLLNGSNGRFYFLTLANKQAFHHIGSDQGLLPAPVAAHQITISPGERIDFLLDFSDHAGEEIILKDQTLNIMQIRVAKGKVTDQSSLPATLRPVPRMDPSTAVKTRRLTLEEVDYLTGEPDVHLLDGKRWHQPISEKPVLNSTEIWEFMNLTDDTHPIHLHLVRFQLLDRRSIKPGAYQYENKLIYTSDAFPPEPHEFGWKDTIRATPGACTRIIVNFSGYVGRYVWHCHILEHEDNEMMRPYEVVAPS
jgi:spore coat protein A